MRGSIALNDLKVIRASLYRPPHRLCDPDRDQRGAGVLSPGAHHARRPAGGGAAGGCLAGTRGAIAHRVRFRSSVAGSVRTLAVARDQWRSRQFHRHGPAGADGSDARGRQHRDAGDCRRPDRLYARTIVRPDRRLFPRHLDRQGRDLHCDRRRVRAALLARHGDGHHLLGAAQLAACGRRRSRRLRRLGLGLGAHALSYPACDHDLSDPDGHRHPHGAGSDRRYPEPGLRRGAARQRPARDRCVPPRHQERRADRACGDGASAWLYARRLDPDRNRVLMAGFGAVAEFRDLPARPAAAAGHDPGAGAVLRGAQSSGRHRASRRSIRASSGADMGFSP